MKRLFLLLLLCGQAHAFDCAPAPLGPGTRPVYRANASGAVVWWYCKLPDGTWNPQYAAATLEWMATSPAIDLASLWATNDRAAAINALFVPTAQMGDLFQVWGPYRAEILAGPK